MERSPSPISARWIAAAVALVMLLLAACGGSTTSRNGVVQVHNVPAAATAAGHNGAPQWQLVWEQAAGDAADSPDAAFAASAMARDPQGALHTPASVWWLTQGPGFALALVQLDAAGQSVGFVVLARGTALGPNWALVVASQLERPTAASGRAWDPLPGGDYSCSGYDVRYAPTINAMLCLSPSRMFLYGHFTLAAARPMGAATVTVNGRQGWVASADSDGFVNAAVVSLADGATYVFGGTAPAGELVRLAAALEGPLLSSAAG